MIFKQFYIKELVLIASSDADASEKAMAKLVEIVGLVNESDLNFSTITALTVIASHGNEADRAQALTIFEANGFVHEIFRPRSRITNIQAFLKRVSSSTIGAA